MIVGIKNFPQYIDSSDKKDFFARCITGYKYITNIDDNKSIRNCLIELLNSSIIDVDKLDYIIRDSNTIGFQSVSIDFTRLLNALKIVEKEGKKTLAFHKSALSIIENVIYAHDSERKWIQNHPVVLYEHFLIQHSIRKLEKYYSNNKSSERLFCYDSLTAQGKEFKDIGKVVLLADEDIIHSIKCICSDDLTWEYFSRNSRRHPVWKSEAEYRDLFDNQIGMRNLDILEKEFKVIEKYTIENLEMPIINESLIKYYEEQLVNLNSPTNGDDEKDINNIKDGINVILKWANCLKDFALSHNIPFDFVIISANKFRSGFLKEDLKKILIDFSSIGNISYIEHVSSILSAERTRENFFYLYYKRGEVKINVNKLARAICSKLFT